MQMPLLKKLQIENKKLREDNERIEQSRGHVYGVRRKITDNTNSSWERIYDSVGLVANATHDGSPVQNDFDSLAPWSEIKSCNYDIETEKIKSWFGDQNFKFDGSNGDVYTYIPDVYLKIYQENDHDYILLSDIERSGFVKYNSFFIARYTAGLVDGKLRSYTDLAPAHNKNIGEFRTLTKSLGDKFCLLDYRYFILQMLYLVEYADFNSQKMLGNGIVNPFNNPALIAEKNTNRIVVSSTSSFVYIGRSIGIGNGKADFSIASDRKVINIEDYSDGSITGKAITFDGEPVDINIGDIIWTCGQHSGQCDNLGMKSGCLKNNNAYSIIYRGIENIFSNMWQIIDGIIIQDRVVHICKDPAFYEEGKITNHYKKLGYINANQNGTAKILGFDPDEPLARFPTEIGADGTTGITDGYYQNSGGPYIAFLMGLFSWASYNGFWYWNLNNGSSYTNNWLGCRVLINI